MYYNEQLGIYSYFHINEICGLYVYVAEMGCELPGIYLVNVIYTLNSQSQKPLTAVSVTCSTPEAEMRQI